MSSQQHNRPCIHPEPRNKAVHRCCQARNRALVECKGLKLGEWASAGIGAESYLASMPDLGTLEDIRDYAACINHAVALRIIRPSEAPPLLASARIVLDSIRTQGNLRDSDARLDISRARLEDNRNRRQPALVPAKPVESAA